MRKMRRTQVIAATFYRTLGFCGLGTWGRRRTAPLLSRQSMRDGAVWAAAQLHERMDTMGRFFNDARYGVRMLLRTPAWTAIMVATLALGIGLATTIFSVVYSVLLRPLPYPEPGRRVALWSQGIHQRFTVSAANWRDSRR